IANAVLMTGYVVLTGIKTASFETLLEWVGGSAWIMLVFLPYYTPLIFGVSYILYRYWQKKEAESRE
ncbi:MAG: hypothetical protein KDK45_19505, partial [Leptospiraceae bacterium]|nr:hypothetical protein [Leptospiraceae bacterium]